MERKGGFVGFRKLQKRSDTDPQSSIRKGVQELLWILCTVIQIVLVHTNRLPPQKSLRREQVPESGS